MLNTEKCNLSQADIYTEPDPAVNHIATVWVNLSNKETKKNSTWQPVPVLGVHV